MPAARPACRSPGACFSCQYSSSWHEHTANFDVPAGHRGYATGTFVTMAIRRAPFAVGARAGALGITRGRVFRVFRRSVASATNATSHGRRSFLVVVMEASRRSRQRPSPLRGSHGGGRCPFVVVTAEVFFTPTQKQRKKRFTCDFRLFLSQEPAWGLRLFAALAPPGEIFGEILENKKKLKKSHLHDDGELNINPPTPCQ